MPVRRYRYCGSERQGTCVIRIAETGVRQTFLAEDHSRWRCRTASESSDILIYGVILIFLIGDETNLFNPISKNTRAVKTRSYLY